MRIQTIQDLHQQFPDLDGWWVYDNFPSVESKLRQLSQTEEGQTPNLEAQTQLVRVLDLQGKLDEAKQVLTEVDSQIKAMPPSTERSRIELRLKLEEGRHLWLSRAPSQSQSIFHEAFKMGVLLKENFFAIDAALMLAISNPPKHQSEWLKQARNLAESSQQEDARLWLPQIYTMQAWQDFDLRRYPEALEGFRRALALPRGRGDRTNTIALRWSEARALRALGQVQEALEIQNELKAEMDRLGQINGYVYLEIAECYQLLQKPEDAKDYFERAHQELSKIDWYKDNYEADLDRMKFLSKLR